MSVWGVGRHKQQYERLDDFVQLRNEWDPKGVFLKPYLESFFCKNGRTAGGPDLHACLERSATESPGAMTGTAPHGFAPPN
jgi:hypothetical protein